jgi:uncharacterized protein (DUF2236 family)
MLLSHRELDSLRSAGDPEADAAVAALGRDVWVVNATLRHVHRNDEPLPDGVPPPVCRFLEAHCAVPPWFDPVRAARAQDFASRHLFQITLALFCASLPTAYGAARGSRVLAATGRMAGKELDRRVNETAQFLLDVVAPGAFSPRGSALRAIQKVRLMHAAVRAHLAAAEPERTEIAINQEDLLGTLFAFSVVVIRALRRLGVSVEPDEAEDYYQLWRAVGGMLGIRCELLPADFVAACDLADRIAARQLEESAHGRALMAELLAGMERHVPAALERAPRLLVRYLVGDALADALGVPADRAAQATLAVARLIPGGSARPLAPVAARLASVVARPLLESVVGVKLRGVPAAFAMPVEV